MPSKTMQHGRLKVYSGDGTPLVKTVDFDMGDFSFERSQPIEQIKVRGRLRELRRGEDEPVTFSFSAIFQDKTLRRCLDQFVWDGQSELLTGLSGGAVNNNVAVAYPYEQNSLQPAATETGFTKIAPGGTPSSDGEIAEEVGAEDIEGVTVVGSSGATVVPGEFSVQMPAADTNLAVVYDAVGQSTLDPGTSDVKTFRIDLEILDPGQPLSPGVVVETYRLDHARVETMPQEEAMPNTISFDGFAYVTRPTITTA